MSEFAHRVERIPTSGIRKVFDAAGEGAINLGIGQPDFAPPGHAKEAAIEAIRSGDADNYTHNKGIRPLREAIVAKHERDQRIDYTTEEVITTAGGSEALHLAIEAHVDPGQEVIIPDPGFVSYAPLTMLAGGDPEPVPLREDLTLDPATVEAHITEETAAFIVNSPGNPTGAVSDPEDIRAFARIADEHDVLCISDEVYEYTVFDGEFRSPSEFAESDNVVVVNSSSKLYAMTGWRIGWVAASERRIDRMLKVHQYMMASASAPAQFAAEAALTGPQDIVEEMRSTFEERRDILLDGLADVGIECPRPQGAFYAMPRVPEGFVEAVLDRDVIVVPGDAFGDRGAGHVRLSYATDTESLKEAIERMGAAYRAVTSTT